MARTNTNATRGELGRLKERLDLASRGHKLLEDKQDELMRNFIDLIRENNRLRKQVEDKLVAIMQDFVLAKSMASDKIVEEFFSLPNKEINLFIDSETIMNIEVPKMFIEVDDLEGRGEGEYSYLASNSGMDETIEVVQEVLDDMLELAEVEKTCQLMADEIEKTRRRVNGLEYRIIPDLQETIKSIEMKLEEAERASITRMMKVKDMK